MRIVRDQQGGRAAAADRRFEVRQEASARGYVEVGGGLVEHEDAGLEDSGAGDRDALRLAPG